MSTQISQSVVLATSALITIPLVLDGECPKGKDENTVLPAFISTISEDYESETSGEVFEYPNNSIALGVSCPESRLYFTKKPTVSFLNYGVLSVPEWDIRVAFNELDLALAKKFLELYSKSRSGNMTQQERRRWVLVSRHIDFDRYNADNAIPFFSQGTIVSFKNGNTKVRWFGGEEENLNSSIKGRLSLFNKGECFSCFRTLDRNGKTNSIKDLLKIDDPQSIDFSDFLNG